MSQVKGRVTPGTRRKLLKDEYGVREAAVLMGISQTYCRELCAVCLIAADQVQIGTTRSGETLYRWSIPKEEIERFRRLPPPRRGRPRGWKPGD